MSQPPYQPEYATPSNYAGGTPLSYAHAEMPVDPGNVWTAIWTRPREVVRWVIATDPTRNVPMLILAGSFASSIGDVGKNSTTPGELLLWGTLGLVLGTVLGFLVSYFVLPWALTMVGRWLGGQGDRVALRAAVAYASIPTICSIPLCLVALLLRLAVLSQPNPQAPMMVPLGIAMIAVGLAMFVVGIWALVVFIGAVAAAHRFSIWLSIATVLILVLALVAVAMAVVLPFVL